MPHHHQHHHCPATDDATDDSAALAELLDLDAEVLHAYWSDVIGAVRDHAPDPTNRILDVGCGTGMGAIALAQRFPRADVVAVDMSAPMLERLRHKARDLGVADRIQTVEADLDAPWPVAGPVELAWASNSMHHLAEPDRVLADLFTTLRPGGLLAVAELESFPRFLPDGAGSDLEARGHAALAQWRADELPHLGADWGPPLTRAGFVIEGERTFDIEVTAPLPAGTGRYAQASLRRLRSGVDGQLAAAELAALDELVDGVLDRGDLIVRATRMLWLARRPLS